MSCTDGECVPHLPKGNFVIIGYHSLFLVSIRKTSEVPQTSVSDLSSLTTVSDSLFSVSVLLSLVELRYEESMRTTPDLRKCFQDVRLVFRIFLVAGSRALTSAGPRLIRNIRRQVLLHWQCVVLVAEVKN